VEVLTLGLRLTVTTAPTVVARLRNGLIRKENVEKMQSTRSVKRLLVNLEHTTPEVDVLPPISDQLVVAAVAVVAVVAADYHPSGSSSSSTIKKLGLNYKPHTVVCGA
jgi:hypothetical protein